MAKVLTPKEFKAEMKKLEGSGDPEIAHSAMDDLLCEQLKALGYSAGIKVFEKQDKWYA